MMQEVYFQFNLGINQTINYHGGIFHGGIFDCKKLYYTFGYETMSRMYELNVFEREIFRRRGIEL